MKPLIEIIIVQKSTICYDDRVNHPTSKIDI